MKNPVKGILWGYFFLVPTAMVAVFAPEYDSFYTMWVITIFVIVMIMPIVLFILFSSNKKKGYGLAMIYQWYASLLFMIFPLMKVLKEEIVYQLLLVGLFISIYFLARLDQRTEVPIVFPDKDRDIAKVKTWLTYMYYVIPAIIAFLGVGGDHIRIRILFDTYGDKVMMPYFSILIYIFGCWLLFLFSSMAYKSHVIDGYLDK
jgi:hypothetical protein